mmetsp:Transcript_18635/g.38097  ORF Transcript_18635/g.38097 Transcript_18635/m.38097 type:complete len:423 (+) Transcript_18635:202-1470(+)|eukprot:CAMPEP_0197549846 /NCGR_PEP_ID=MMETSP1320-20131121/3637_1 /TAXON_ID=91990 /ORGANISM="Bolidomonas sp., Strain RCC2347" /LENGTH=422 /DNA_ID=CAMNT_0043110131 /DNA_START=175 /DNA_END=1443 /DNA_ORIENTATION=-
MSVSVKAPVAAAFADYFGLGSLSPLLPFFVLDKVDNLDTVGFILSAQYGGVIIGSTLAGMFSDKIGRRNTLLISLTGDVIFFTLTGFVESITAMVIVRTLAGICTPLAASIAWLLDAAGDDMGMRAKNQGLFGMCSVAGFMSGAALGGFMGYSLFTMANCFCGAFAFFALCLTIAGKEPDRPNSDSKPEGRAAIIKSAGFLSLALCYFVVGLQFTGVTTLIAIVLPERYGYVEWQIAVMMMLVTFVHFFLMVFLKQLTTRFGTVNLIMASFLISIIGQILFLFEFSYESDIFVNFLFLLCTFVLPLGMTGANILAPGVADAHGKNARGMTIGMLRTVFNVGQAAGPAYGVSLYNIDNPINRGAYFMLAQTVFMVIVLVVLWSVWKLPQNDKVASGSWEERKINGREEKEKKEVEMSELDRSI